MYRIKVVKLLLLQFLEIVESIFFVKNFINKQNATFIFSTGYIKDTLTRTFSKSQGHSLEANIVSFYAHYSKHRSSVNGYEKFNNV